MRILVNHSGARQSAKAPVTVLVLAAGTSTQLPVNKEKQGKKVMLSGRHDGSPTNDHD